MALTRAEHQTIERRLNAERAVGPARFVQGGPRVALLYPSPYRAGMASLGFQWVLSMLLQAGVSVERAFLPDDVLAWRASGSPLLTYETRSPVSHFPVVAVSLAYELELTGLIQALELAGIPPLRQDRGPTDPRVVLGGPLTFSNPLPAAPFVDAMLLGEAEDALISFITAALDKPTEAFLDTVAGLPGGYSPQRHGDQLPAIARASDTRLPARGCILAPESELRDMFLIEAERGCHRSCTFCVMRRSTNGGMRLVQPEQVLDLVPAQASRVGLVGAAISDHPRLVPLLEQLVDRGIEVGVSSLRADRVARKPDIARLLRAGGYQTLTVASDAASKRLRRTIQKGTTEAQLMTCAHQVREYGFRTLKVYMMIGLPDETDEDLDELVQFTRQLSRVCPVALAVAPFVPKRHTPMADAHFAGIKLIERRLKRLHRELRGTCEVRPTSARWAWVESELALGGAEAGLAVLQALQAGGRFADWKRALRRSRPADAATP